MAQTICNCLKFPTVFKCSIAFTKEAPVANIGSLKITTLPSRLGQLMYSRLISKLPSSWCLRYALKKALSAFSK